MRKSVECFVQHTTLNSKLIGTGASHEKACLLSYIKQGEQKKCTCTGAPTNMFSSSSAQGARSSDAHQCAACEQLTQHILTHNSSAQGVNS